jgi:hypothetical protein
LGKLGIDMSIYTVFMLVSAAYVALYLNNDIIEMAKAFKVPSHEMRYSNTLNNSWYHSHRNKILNILFTTDIAAPNRFNTYNNIIGYLTRHIGQARLIFG